MEMHQIRYFLAVCDNRNFTKAAHRSFVSQPSLTQAIHRLEEELGGKLFSRGRQGANLTALGRLIETNLRAVYETSQQTKELAIRFQRLQKEPIRVGILPSLAPQKINRFLASYQKENPQVELEMRVEKEKELQIRWTKDEVDLLVVTSPKTRERGVSFQPLYREKYVIVLPEGHALTKKKQLSLSDLQSQPYLDRLHCERREALKECLKKEGSEWYARYRSNCDHWLIDMVREGIGFALLPEYSLAGQDSGVVSRPLTSPEISREVGVLSRKARGPVKKFLTQLVNFYR